MGTYTDNDPCFTAHFNLPLMQYAQPTPQPTQPSQATVATAATRLPNLLVASCHACTDITTGKLSKYQLMATEAGATLPTAFDLSIASYEAIQLNPELKQTLEFHAKDCVDKKGKPFRSTWAFVRGYSRFQTQEVAF